LNSGIDWEWYQVGQDKKGVALGESTFFEYMLCMKCIAGYRIEAF
jgi:hypothetical protein